VGDDPKIQKIKELINGVAQDGETTVLIRGETGTGKELVAKAIHRLGVRSQWPFVTTALVEKNIETIVSELFGHERGKKTEAWKWLGYKKRFSMLRRVKRIMSEYPGLAEQFPELKKSYS